MSTGDRLLLILHIGFAIFALGPLTAATMATPRYIRAGNTTVLRFLNRSTRVYAIAALGVFLVGLVLARGRYAEVWLSASMTLFIVGWLLLVVVERDQRKSLHKLTGAGAGVTAPGAEKGKAAERSAGQIVDTKAEQGRIAALAGIIAIIWIVILVLMVWQ
ncbi:hypothetical protein LO762_01425 [Actinocorallia sp. API 0066]|uniref:hypothetical protein n=1 Tax=Actinocorallia sp. API 0066 TaxID=2896846 RepID=UPI001E533B3D|nr:hypothetical protein [Actinocorallia sp. API 0066]MCD0447861.1 hypothetical protein [Actinocorallia sp. API 0066]